MADARFQDADPAPLALLAGDAEDLVRIALARHDVAALDPPELLRRTPCNQVSVDGVSSHFWRVR